MDLSLDEIKGRNKEFRNKSLLNVSEEGAVFKSYVDGRNHFLTPEKSIEIQRRYWSRSNISF